MIILGLHPGPHDASATLLDDYRVLGAVQLERLNRIKGSGIEHEAWAWPCADELLSMHGLRRSDVDAVAFTRESFPRIYLHKMQTPLRRLAHAFAPGILAKRPTKMLLDAINKQGTHDPALLFDLYNEPHDISWSCWRYGCATPDGWQTAGMETLVNVVRSAGATQPVTSIEAPSSASARGVPRRLQSSTMR